MAGVYIPGLPMPEFIKRAEIGLDADGNGMFFIYQTDSGVPDIYPVIPVPNHGRLIDADALLEAIAAHLRVYVDAIDVSDLCEIIRKAPTINEKTVVYEFGCEDFEDKEKKATNCKTCKNPGCAQRGIDFQKQRCDGYIQMTNADRLCAMSDVELAEFFTSEEYDGAPSFTCPVPHSCLDRKSVV